MLWLRQRCAPNAQLCQAVVVLGLRDYVQMLQIMMSSTSAESSCGFYWALQQLAWCLSDKLMCAVTGLAVEVSVLFLEKGNGL